MGNTSDFKNGLILNHKGSLWKIVEFLHVKPGKGSAFVRTKLKNIKNGQVVDETFRSGQKIETVRVEAKDYNYIYNDDTSYYFMDSETFEQISLNQNQINPNSLLFMIENTKVKILFDKEEAIEVRIPSHMNLKVIQTDPGFKGDTSQGGTKPAVLETGVVIQVPLFINEGDKVRIDTQEKRYIERSK